MKEYKVAFAEHTATIRVPETLEDCKVFIKWLESLEGQPLAVDTETTGLDIFSDEFRCRTLQVGHGTEAWVIPLEAGFIKDPTGVIRWVLADRELYFQNAAYDILVLRRCFNYEVDWDKVTDTKILAHLVDSRSKKEGGFGHSLQELTHEFIDKKTAEDIKGSMTEMAKEIGCKKAELFATIDVWNDTYLTYAGMDVVLTYGLKNILEPMVPERSKHLIRYEHEIARICCEMEYNGFLLDVDYANKLSEEFKKEQELWEAVALVDYGVESVNANADVAQALLDTGVKLTQLTPKGEKLAEEKGKDFKDFEKVKYYKVDKALLEKLASQGNLLAHAVTEAKKAKKWRTSWVDKFLDQADSNNRCHASINPLLARTARMSVTGIPAQTLPSSDWRIRRCFIAEEDYTVISCDYQAQELRVLAALSGDKNMRDAFANEADLHQMTADASGVERKVGKTVNFAYVYGSGAGNIAETCGITIPKAREVIKGFETTFPGVKALSERLQYQAKRDGFIYTPTGRRLWVDPERPYAALNYMIQSTSRDVTCNALLSLDKAGLTKYLRLPIHDEVVAVVPSANAEEAAQVIADHMAMWFKGVHVGTDADVYGPSWGSGYVKPEDDDYQDYLDTLKED